MAQIFKFNKNNKSKKTVDKILEKLSEKEKKEMLGTLLAFSNQQTITKVIQPAVETGYDDAYIYLYENYLDGINDENQEEKLLPMIEHILKRYGDTMIKRLKYGVN